MVSGRAQRQPQCPFLDGEYRGIVYVGTVTGLAPGAMQRKGPIDHRLYSTSRAMSRRILYLHARTVQPAQLSSGPPRNNAGVEKCLTVYMYDRSRVDVCVQVSARY